MTRCIVENAVGSDQIRDWIDSDQLSVDQSNAIHDKYGALNRSASADDYVDLRLIRSKWAKDSTTAEIERLSVAKNRAELIASIELLHSFRGFLTPDQVERIAIQQQALGDATSGKLVAELFVDQGDPATVREHLPFVSKDPRWKTRLGPRIVSEFRPIRRSGRRFQPNQWLEDPSMGEYEFVDGNPDHVRFRGIEFRSGDIGIVQLRHGGDGILEGFLETPGVAPHAMLFVTRRVKVNNETLYQPSAVEIYEGGWRSVPLSTALSPNFSWYSEWVRPSQLPENIGVQLSSQLDNLGPLAFDFQSRKAPENGDFSDWEQPCATCTNFLRIPFEMVGIQLPYPATEMDRRAKANLERLGHPPSPAIYTPTDILLRSDCLWVGLVDNGFPELALAQALVIGRPHLPMTIGGLFCNKELVPEKMPDWRSISRWKYSWDNVLVSIGQSSSLLGKTCRALSGVEASSIPLSASPTLIAFYLRSDLEANYIVNNVVGPRISKRSFPSFSTFCPSKMAMESDVEELVAHSVRESSLVRAGWYAM